MNQYKPLWIDMEMTGLDEKKDAILEIAAIITDLDFNVLAEYETVVFQPPEVVAGMNEWCVKTHGASGLTAKIQHGKPQADVEKDLLVLVEKHYSATERVVIAGNSIGNDRRFIDAYLPKFASRLHYRMIDVSSFKEIFRNKYGIEHKKGDKHRAIDDIRESIAELKNYLSYVKIA